jgi:hypothetical protein
MAMSHLKTDTENKCLEDVVAGQVDEMKQAMLNSDMN